MAPRFRIITLPDGPLPLYVLAPDGIPILALSRGLSGLVAMVTPGTLRQYCAALRTSLDRWAGQAPTKVDRLFVSVAEARAAVFDLLHANGCRVRRSRLPDGSYIVTVPPCAETDAAESVRRAANRSLPIKDGVDHRAVNRIELSLITLSHCYEQLYARGEWDGGNPMRVDDVGRLQRLAAFQVNSPAWAGGLPVYAGRQFIVESRACAFAPRDDPWCRAVVLAAAAEWPAGIAAATRLTAACGDRISETLALTVADWARFDFGDRIAAPSKGSRGVRSKTLYLTPQALRDLIAYVDGPRAEAAGVGLRALRRCHQSARAECLAGMPLFLNPSGRAISYSLYADHYFRPTMRRLGFVDITPHRLRHEHALRTLIQIRRLARDRAEELAMIAEYADIQAWRSGPRMVQYYAPQFRALAARAFVERLSRDAGDTGGECAGWDSATGDAREPVSPSLTLLPPTPSRDRRLTQFIQGAD